MLENFRPTEVRYEADRRIVRPGKGTCKCGTTVYMESTWANECPKCGREYNGSGSELAPRSQWGEETGESVQEMESFLGGDW